MASNDITLIDSLVQGANMGNTQPIFNGQSSGQQPQNGMSFPAPVDTRGEKFAGPPPTYNPKEITPYRQQDMMQQPLQQMIPLYNQSEAQQQIDPQMFAYLQQQAEMARPTRDNSTKEKLIDISSGVIILAIVVAIFRSKLFTKVLVKQFPSLITGGNLNIMGLAVTGIITALVYTVIKLKITT